MQRPPYGYGYPPPQGGPQGWGQPPPPQWGPRPPYPYQPPGPPRRSGSGCAVALALVSGVVVLVVAIGVIGVVASRGASRPAPPTEATTAATESPETPATVASDPPLPPGSPRPPPPVRKPQLFPPLPTLPSLSMHEAQTVPPPIPKGFATYSCGVAWNGSEHVPLACLVESGNKIEKAAEALVPADKLNANLAPKPVVVDHRADGTEGAVRNQNPTGTCTAFGMASAIDHSVARWTGKPAHVSVMHVWGRYHDTLLSDALEGSIGKGITSEENWPFAPTEAWSWRNCDTNPMYGGTSIPCGQPVDHSLLASADAKPVVEIEQVEWLPKDFPLMRAKLAAGQDLVFAIFMPKSFDPTGTPGARYIPDYDVKDRTGGGHIMTIAGYALMSGTSNGGADGNNYYLLHNSWGTAWGDLGYAWIHEATLVKHMASRYGVVDAHLVDGPGGRAHRAVKACTGALVPDSLTGKCVERCGDGSPRHNDACPRAEDCPSGYVNLTGACMIAAPTSSSSDPGSGIKWECGPGGCAFWLPKGMGDCGGTQCVMSCPAPAFKVAKDKNGLTCIE